ncbi:MAG: homocysteine S-methyltransferase family protein [Actinobacteria bacterium]|nr:homocysteine S-methyltransferase family protein [Actinomycetota bacterium]
MEAAFAASAMRRTSPAYDRIARLLAAEEPVILDGGNATELEREQAGELRNADRGLWGTGALYQAPYAVLDVHRRYVAGGCDLISTNTWAILAASELEAGGVSDRSGPTHWMDVARLGIKLARTAVEEQGRAGSCAIAFSVNGDVDGEQRLGTLRLLARVLESDPPDLILMETMSLIREDLTMRAVETALGTGLPVWLSFRRCRHGVCGVYGQHWGGPEGDLFGRAAREFESLGVSALLINCLPPEHVDGMLPWLRDFTDLPLGVYPNLGYFSDSGWRFDERVGPDEYAQLALRWRSEGAQIIGGCCGTSPAHIAAARTKLLGTKPGRPRSLPLPDPVQTADLPARVPPPWTDKNGRAIYPLSFPELTFDPDVFVPTVGSMLVWEFLLRHQLGAGKRCLDVGCGSGLLATQLALNGAERVHAIDIQREAVANTLANAFRNGVAERVTGAEVDLYMFEPSDRYDVVVASLYQMPVDPFEQFTGHRPLDYWGRNLVDHLLELLPHLLEKDGRAYVMQLSILSQLQTAELLEGLGLTSRVADLGFFPFTPVFKRNAEQIRRVEELSDAFHLTLGSEDVMAAYVLEIGHAT